MIIAIGSENPTKLKAVETAFTMVWPNEVWQAIGVSVKSGVSDQPMSDEESIRGATQRARLALAANPDAEYGIGLEGGIQEIGGIWYDCGWAAVVDKNGVVGYGSSARMPVPEKMMALIREGTELGFAGDAVFGTKMSKQDMGHFGLMTDNILNRTDAYRDGVICALSRFIHPELFEK